MDKIKVSQWLINVLIAILLMSYGWIFNSTTNRIEKVEAKIESFNPVILQIQTDIAKIKTDIEWIKTKYK